jgi:LacI family transcriptional regulator
MSRPTIADLAKAAGVGISTVDRVLNGRQPVRRATAERVLDAAQQIGFYATGVIRQRLGADEAERTLAFVLQQRSMPFYTQLGNALAAATKAAAGVNGRPRIEFVDELTPDAVSERILAMGKDADAIAVVAADHPRVTQAIDRLRDRGKPVFALISDLSASSLAGYIGLDNWKVGRTAAWAVSSLCKRPGQVGIFVGSHRYRCQEACEMSFRSYFREHASDFRLLEPRTSLEDVRYAYESTLDLLEREPDLVGLFVAGGGVEGVMRALREGDTADRVVTIGLDLTEETRSGLIDGVLKLVLSHPLKLLAETAVDAMARAIERNEAKPLPQILLPFDVYTPENI